MTSGRYQSSSRVSDNIEHTVEHKRPARCCDTRCRVFITAGKGPLAVELVPPSPSRFGRRASHVFDHTQPTPEAPSEGLWCTILGVPSVLFKAGELVRAAVQTARDPS